MGAYEDNYHDHRRHVDRGLRDIATELVVRANMHDRSKMEPEEREIYKRVTPEFANVQYGTPEYEAVKAKLGPALDHHYQHNDHHPEHFENGIAQMDLMQLAEMTVDRYAAWKRNPTISLMESLEIMRKQYGVQSQLFAIIVNTTLWLQESDGEA